MVDKIPGKMCVFVCCGLQAEQHQIGECAERRPLPIFLTLHEMLSFHAAIISPYLFANMLSCYHT